MLRGIVLGTVLGIFGAATGILAIIVLEPLFQGGGRLPSFHLAGGPRILKYTALYGGPGAFLLSIPLCLLLRSRSDREMTRPSLLTLDLLVGALAGVLNLLGTALILGGSGGLAVLFTEKEGLWMAVPALAGGLGLGVGCFWGLPRKEGSR
jgi:hypothetical protein